MEREKYANILFVAQRSRFQMKKKTKRFAFACVKIGGKSRGAHTQSVERRKLAILQYLLWFLINKSANCQKIRKTGFEVHNFQHTVTFKIL